MPPAGPRLGPRLDRDAGLQVAVDRTLCVEARPQPTMRSPPPAETPDSLASEFFLVRGTRMPHSG